MDQIEQLDNLELINENINYKDINNSWTIDPYYDALFYNETKSALRNNNVNYLEFLSIKQPYHWYLATEEKPIAINYKPIVNSRIKFLVTKVKPLTPNDEYKLYRRNGQTFGDYSHFIENDALLEARKSKYSCFFHITNKNELLEISKYYPNKIYYFGKYFNNKYRVCLANHPGILGFINNSNVLLEKNNLNGVGEFEAELNFNVFKRQDYLIKYIDTPYALNGKYHNVSIQGDRAYKSKYILT